MGNRKVNLFVVGAMRAGTTSFMDILSHHPEIYVSPIKEPNYFVDDLPKELYEPSRFFNIDRYFDKEFPNPLHITKIEERAHYNKLYSLSNDQKYLVDGSTSYLHEPNAAHRIKEYNPEAKIIIITRDPLERAFSHYRMDVGLGREIRSFDDVIKEEIELFNKGKLPWYSFLNMSCYGKSIEKYKEHFGHVMIINFSNLTNDTKKELNHISQFLNIGTFPFQSLPHNNTSYNLIFKKVFYYFKILGLKDYFSITVNRKLRLGLFNFLKKNDKLKLSKKMKKELIDVFNMD